MTQPSVLPADVERALAAVGQRLENGQSVEMELPAAIAGISELPATTISQAARAITNAAKLYRWRRKPSWFESLFRRHMSDDEQLLRLPNIAYLFLFHCDGRIRQAALDRITGEVPTPFLFAAIALRLNDWVEPVRAAAVACAQRCFPLTSPDVIAGAATALLLRQGSWQRWDKEREAVETAFARPDVGVRLADDLINAQTGPASRVLRAALKYDALDLQLERLAAGAKQPSVRALAVQTVANTRASWPVGKEWKWVDKSLGKRVRVPKFDSREITVPLRKEAIIKAASFDPSALVRKASLDALIRHEGVNNEARDIAVRLVTDRSRSVRERAAFILARSDHATSSTRSADAS